MSKMSNLSLTLDQLIETGERIVTAAKEIAACGEILITTAKDIKSVFSADALAVNQLEAKATITPAALPDSKEPEKTYTKEDVRAVLAEKSSAGYRNEVKELLAKYGATQLKQVDPQSYAALMEEAQVIGNG